MEDKELKEIRLEIVALQNQLNEIMEKMLLYMSNIDTNIQIIIQNQIAVGDRIDKNNLFTILNRK